MKKQISLYSLIIAVAIVNIAFAQNTQTVVEELSSPPAISQIKPISVNDSKSQRKTDEVINIQQSYNGTKHPSSIREIEVTRKDSHYFLRPAPQAGDAQSSSNRAALWSIFEFNKSDPKTSAPTPPQ